MVNGRTIARVKSNGDLFIAGELRESGDKPVSFDLEGNMYTSDFAEVANIPAVARFTNGMKLSGEITEGRIDNPIMDGLVLWYDFSQKGNGSRSRAVADDLSGNGNSGELVNFAFESGSGYEDGLRFDGVDDYVSCVNPLYSYPNLEQKWTIEILVEIQPVTTWRYLVRGINGGLRILPDGRLLLYLNSGINDYYQYSNPVDFEGKYKLLTFLFDNVQGLKDIFANSININGVQEINRTSTPSGMEESLLIGGILKGEFGSLKIYNRALTPEEIAHNYAIEKERCNL